MFEQGDLPNILLDWMVTSFGKVYSIIWVGFYLNTEKCFFLDVSC